MLTIQPLFLLFFMNTLPLLLSGSEVIPNFLGLLQDLLILSIFFIIIYLRKYLLVATTIEFYSFKVDSSLNAFTLKFFSFLRWHFEGLTCHHSFLVLFVANTDIVFTSFLAHVKHSYCVFENVFLHFIVERRIRRERRWLVYFNQPRTKVLIDHHIKSKDLEAHRIINTFRLAYAIHVVHVRLSNYDSLHNHIFNFIPYLIRITPLLVYNFHYCKEWTFVASLFLVFIIIFIAIIAIVSIIIITTAFLLLIILLEISVHLVNCIISQVNIHVINIGSSRFFIGLGSEAS